MQKGLYMDKSHAEKGLNYAVASAPIQESAYVSTIPNQRRN